MDIAKYDVRTILRTQQQSLRAPKDQWSSLNRAQGIFQQRIGEIALEVIGVHYASSINSTLQARE